MSEYVTSLKSLFKTGAEKVVEATGRVVEKTEDVVHTVGEKVQGYLDPPERHDAKTQTESVDRVPDELEFARRRIAELEEVIARIEPLLHDFDRRLVFIEAMIDQRKLI